ncbi:hypothetical protein BV25DRAFT_1915870 [Artomyces pyxidatus]|uniref:Uncharacterized protein n=1 Tax=Artomyces pyxidatus TaxID=48021 RepID=A0ACB8T3Q1_9AGAM|nr:hypothetical protein BV25DRAFT_1915870 [Artomyces pyxidatus]
MADRSFLQAPPTEEFPSVSYIDFFLDFFDIRQRVPVSTPAGYAIYPIPAPGDYQYGDKLISWDVAMGYDPHTTGVAEKFSVPEGSRMRLIRPGHEDFYLMAPVRQSQFNFAQAVPFLPIR